LLELRDDARVQAAEGNATNAIDALKPVLAEATKYGYLTYELEARLELREIEMKSGTSPEARLALASLATDAKTKDFLLIARKARAALNR